MASTLLLGDCLKMLPHLGKVDAVVTDPPYGISHKTDYRRFSGGRYGESRLEHPVIHGDDSPFDPAAWIGFPKVVLFGFNCYSDRLPRGSLLVWCKKPISKLGKFMGDCEVAWRKGGHGTYLFHHVWDGVCRETETGKFLHPSQKPVALMRWVIDGLKLKPGATILDPYMGSGTTGVAATQLGFNFVGCEIDPVHFATAQRRIREAENATPLLAGVS